jgi:hypothetical protein
MSEIFPVLYTCPACGGEHPTGITASKNTRLTIGTMRLVCPVTSHKVTVGMDALRLQETK